MWILTNEYNEYDQNGDYFIYAWRSKPSKEQLKQVLMKDCPDFLCGDAAEDKLDHVYNGGGRQNVEHIWYNFFEFKP